MYFIIFLEHTLTSADEKETQEPLNATTTENGSAIDAKQRKSLKGTKSKSHL